MSKLRPLKLILALNFFLVAIEVHFNVFWLLSIFEIPL